jgi:hypothetical protein
MSLSKGKHERKRFGQRQRAGPSFSSELLPYGALDLFERETFP